MAQQGYRFKKDGSWYLRYRDNFSVDGKIVRKQKCVKLAEYSDRYRREGDLDDLVAEKMAGVRQAGKCTRSCDSFASFVEDTYLPYVRENKKASTAAGYRSYWLRYIKPRTTQFAVRDFTVAITSKLLADIAAAHSLNIETIGKVRSILSGIFTYALATGAFPGKTKADNPCAGALLPKARCKGKTVAASVSDVKAILARLNEEGLLLARAAVAICSLTGARPGEARGLKWEDWSRGKEQLHVQRSVWHTHETAPKTEASVRYVTVTDELRTILLALWNAHGSPISGYILARSGGGRVNLDNESKRVIAPALNRCSICQKSELQHDAKTDHNFKRDADASIPWFGWYSLRRFHGTQVRENAGNSETMAKALGNTREVADKHYNKATQVLPDVRRAVNDAMRGLSV
jgi:integrase